MKILIVDDNRANRKLLVSYFAAEDYSVIEADDGRVAIERYREDQPDIVLMDIMMPNMDGYEAAKQIKALAGDVYVPLIYVTALKPEVALTEAIEAGGDDFISKPINFEILKAKLEAHLRIRQASEKMLEMNAQLQQHNKRMQQENDLVEHIFNNALSKSYLDESFIRYHISSVSAFNGDLLLAEKRADGSTCVLMGDFTGHGLCAAIGSLPVIKVFFTMVKKGLPLNQIIAEINTTIKMLLPANIFLCATLIELNYQKQQIELWSGGLPPIIVYDQTSKTCRKIKSQHMPLGILSDNDFSDEISVFAMNSNEKMYLYTDGVTDIRNAQGEMYGAERLDRIFETAPDDAFNRLIEDQQAFRGDVPQLDDMTLIELSLMPPALS